jgi:hypothetical protein
VWFRSPGETQAKRWSETTMSDLADELERLWKRTLPPYDDGRDPVLAERDFARAVRQNFPAILKALRQKEATPPQ